MQIMNGNLTDNLKKWLPAIGEWDYLYLNLGKRVLR